uniref:RING-type domain-containing protein n=1 Tax=Oryza barthii TaxID=65489 RepID=A0A0D3H835_9ORYZ
MGISSMPAPKDSLVLYVLYNAVVSAWCGRRWCSWGSPRRRRCCCCSAARNGGEDAAVAVSVSAAAAAAVGPSLADTFRARFRPARFGRRRCGGGATADCRVCLVRFEAEAVVNRLPCGHIFHRACLEKWLDYDHATCPLCRHRLLPATTESPSPSPATATPHFARI